MKASLPGFTAISQVFRSLATTRSSLLAVGLLGVALVLRVVFLGDRQLFRDEAASWLLAQYPWSQLITHAAAEPYPPLYALVLKSWISLIGDSEVALRSLSTIFGMVMVVIGWRWASESLGRRAGLISLAILAISPLAIANARDTRMYAMETAFTTLGWWLTWRLASGRSEGRRAWIEACALVLATAAELWTFSFGVPVAALQFAVCVVPWIRHRQIGSALAPAAIVAGGITFLPWLPTIIAHAGGLPFWTPTPQIADLGETFAVMIGGRQLPWVLGAYVIFGLSVVGVVALIRGRGAILQETLGMVRTTPRLLVITLIAGLALVPLVWLYSQFHSFYDSRYFAASLAPLALATAVGWWWIFDRIRPLLARSVAGIALTLLLLGGAVSWLEEWKAEVGLAPAQELLAALRQRMEAGDVALALDARSYFQIAYLLGREAMPADLPGPLLTWGSGNEPSYYGQSLLRRQALVSASETRAIGLKASLRRLAPAGRIWLIALANGTTEDLGFAPLKDGQLREVERLFISPTGEVGQLRELVLTTLAR